MYIAVFDSGIGGITVLRDALQILPHENFIYYGDTLNAPYGIQSQDRVKELTYKSVAAILEYPVKALVVACNTATSVAINDLRKDYDFPIIGMEPAIKPAINYSQKMGGKILVLATPLTLKEKKFENLVNQLQQEHLIDPLPLPEMVEYAENLNFNAQFIENYINTKFADLNLDDYNTIVLGCTHFIFYKQILEKILPEHISVIDGNCGTVNQLKNVLIQNRMLTNNNNQGEVIIHLSGQEADKISVMRQYLQLDK